MILFVRVDVIELGQNLLKQFGHFIGCIVAVVLLVPVDVVKPVLEWVWTLVQVNSILPGAEMKMFRKSYKANLNRVTAGKRTSFAR